MLQIFIYLFYWVLGLERISHREGNTKILTLLGSEDGRGLQNLCPEKRSRRHQYNREKTGVTAHRGGSVWERRAGCHFKSQSRAPQQPHGTTSPPTWVPSPGFWLTCDYRERGAGSLLSKKGKAGYLVASVLLRSAERSAVFSKPFCPSLPLAGWKYWKLSSWNNERMGEGRGRERSFARGDSLNKGEAAALPSRVWSLGSPLKGRKRECLPARHHL